MKASWPRSSASGWRTKAKSRKCAAISRRESWHDSTRLGQSTCLLLDAADVEGRGLKEVLMSAAMLAVVLGGSTASAGDVKPASASVSKFASFFGGDSKHGEKLQVKTQKLVQESPRIYRDVLEAPHSDMRVIVNIGAQRAYIVKDGRIAFDTPISSASTGHRTPRGTFAISEKVRSGKMSTIYKCPLPGWMRLGETAVGMHQGDLPGYPASHGCIRMPLESALFIFDQVRVGTPVEVVDSWSPAPVAGRRLVWLRRRTDDPGRSAPQTQILPQRVVHCAAHGREGVRESDEHVLQRELLRERVTAGGVEMVDDDLLVVFHIGSAAALGAMMQKRWVEAREHKKAIGALDVDEEALWAACLLQSLEVVEVVEALQVRLLPRHRTGRRQAELGAHDSDVVGDLEILHADALQRVAHEDEEEQIRGHHGGAARHEHGFEKLRMVENVPH